MAKNTPDKKNINDLHSMKEQKKIRLLRQYKDISKQDMFLENPFVLFVLVCLLATMINNLLELKVTKEIFAWVGYYINDTLYWYNTTFPPFFKNHPYVKLPIIYNPVNEQVLAFLSPWMWLRGFIIGSFIVGELVTIIEIQIIKSKNLIFGGILVGIGQYLIYLTSSLQHLSPESMILVFLRTYPEILWSTGLSLVFMILGGEYALYLIRNDKYEIKFIEGIVKKMYLR